MESNNIRIKVNLNSREFEVDGDHEIIFKNFGQLLNDYLDIIKKEPKTPNRPNQYQTGSQPSNGNATTTEFDVEQLPDSFGELFNKFPKSISNVDKLLLAGFYIQSHNENNTYTVVEGTELLLDQGIKLSNPNAFNKSNVATKRVFKLSGKNFRISDIGMSYIKALLGNNK